MAEPSMTVLDKQILDNVDRAINETPEAVTKFAPKYRGANSAGSLAVIHTDIRNKTINSLDEDIKRVEDHLMQLKSVRDELKRIVGEFRLGTICGSWS